MRGVTAKRIDSPADIERVWQEGKIPLLIDPENRIRAALKPRVVLDAILAKRNIGTAISDAPLVIGLGPGFTAGKDVHIVIETNRGHDLGRLIFTGEAEPNTGIPGDIAGYGIERVLRATADGIFHNVRAIGDQVVPGDVIAEVEGKPGENGYRGCRAGTAPGRHSGDGGSESGGRRSPGKAGSMLYHFRQGASLGRGGSGSDSLPVAPAIGMNN